jgi:hypothetical protein
MSLDRTDIANNALSGIGSSVIQDIDDEDSPLARKVKTVYEKTLRGMGRRHNWNCLLKRSELGPDLDNVDPLGEWEYAYRLPSDCLKLVQLNGVDAGRIPGKYSLEGRHILSNDDEAKIQYVSYDEDSTIYDALFVEAFVILLSSNLATVVRQDEGLAASKLQEFEAMLSEARSKDGNERRKFPYNQASESRWVASRRYSTNG